jgi:murein L,D-transpeptidase YcbB/YkuD
MLCKYLDAGRLPFFADDLSDSRPEIPLMENKLRWYRKVMEETDFRECRVIAKVADSSNSNLLEKLRQLGLSNADHRITTPYIKECIKAAQLQFGLLADGAIRSTLLQELNRPLKERYIVLPMARNRL